MDGGQVGGFGHFFGFFWPKKVVGSSPGGRGFGGHGPGPGPGPGPGALAGAGRNGGRRRQRHRERGRGREWGRVSSRLQGALWGAHVTASIAPGTWVRNRAHSKRNRLILSDHIPSIASCLAPAASPTQESARWGGREPAHQGLISTARRRPPLHLLAQAHAQVETSPPQAPTRGRRNWRDSHS